MHQPKRNDITYEICFVMTQHILYIGSSDSVANWILFASRKLYWIFSLSLFYFDICAKACSASIEHVNSNSDNVFHGNFVNCVFAISRLENHLSAFSQNCCVHCDSRPCFLRIHSYTHTHTYNFIASWRHYVWLYIQHRLDIGVHRWQILNRKR